MKKENKMCRAIGYSHIANDGRSVQVHYCEESDMWILSGRKPHKKRISIVFSTEAINQVIKSLLMLASDPEVKARLQDCSRLKWKRYLPVGQKRKAALP